MTWVTSVPILVFLGLSVLDLRPDVRDRQTNVRQKHRLMSPPIRGGGITKLDCKVMYSVVDIDGHMLDFLHNLI